MKRERAHRAGEGDEPVSEITKAIAARQAQITELQSDIETLKRAASIVGRKGTTAKATSQPKAKRKIKRKRRKLSAPGQPKPKRHVWSAAEKAAIGKRMKAYWAKRRKAGRLVGGPGGWELRPVLGPFLFRKTGV